MFFPPVSSLHPSPRHSEPLKVGSGCTITVPMDITSVPVAALTASGTTKLTISAMPGRELLVQVGVDLAPPAEAAEQSLQELVEVSLSLLPAVVDRLEGLWLRREEAEDLHLAGWDSIAPTAGALVVSRRRSLAMSLAPENHLLWPAWFTGTYTEKRGAGAGTGRTTTVAASRRTLHIRGILLLKDWRARRHVLPAPTVAPALAAAPLAQTPSAVPAAAPVAGE